MTDKQQVAFIAVQSKALLETLERFIDSDNAQWYQLITYVHCAEDALGTLLEAIRKPKQKPHEMTFGDEP